MLINKRDCEWVGARLPLWVDQSDGTDGVETRSEGGILTPGERRQIEGHLAKCRACRQHRTSLEQALRALAIAANELPVLADATSLWPLLERRIAIRESKLSTSTLARSPQATRALADRSDGPWAELDGIRPLKEAWADDAMIEPMADRIKQAREPKRPFDLILKLTAAAAVIAGVIGMMVARQQWKNAQSTIFANSAPLSDPALPDIANESAREIVERDNGDNAADYLAEADPPRSAESPAPGLDAATAAAALKSPPNARLGFDLDLGKPMPPDSRDAKPVY